MTGLILKDALVLKKSLKSYLLLLAVYAVLTVTGLFSISFVAAFLEVIAMMLPMSAFAFDEQAHWDRYAAALPLSRRDLVAARYLFTLLVLLCAAAFGAAMCVVVSFSGDWDAVWECGMSIAVTMLLGVLALSVAMPLNYRLGPERARPALYLTILLPVAAIFVSFKMDIWSANGSVTHLEDLPPLLILLPLIFLAVVALAVSFAVSCGIMAEKDC